MKIQRYDISACCMYCVQSRNDFCFSNKTAPTKIYLKDIFIQHHCCIVYTLSKNIKETSTKMYIYTNLSNKQYEPYVQFVFWALIGDP